MSEWQTTALLVEAAHKWRQLTERRHEHFVEMFHSGRWKHYYTEEQFLRYMREVDPSEGPLVADRSAFGVYTPARSYRSKCIRHEPRRGLSAARTPATVLHRTLQTGSLAGVPFFMLSAFLTHPPTYSCDMQSALFSPTRLAGLELANRIVVSPMCQYSADDGVASDWHLNHLGMLANSGAGMVVVEATGVERRGRITHGCLGIYSDDCEAALARVVAHCRRYGAAKLGIQLAHAGRKASASRPWEGSRALVAGEDPWETIAPSAIPFGPNWHVPREMAAADMERVRDAFVARGAACSADWLRRHRAARGSRLSHPQFCFADLQHAERRLWRFARGTHALSTRDRRGGARCCAEGHAARRAHHGC